MKNELDNILFNSSKVELIERLEKDLVSVDKAIVILIWDKPNGSFSSQMSLLGVKNVIDVLGILESAKYDYITQTEEQMK